jgi:hypothetical protein
MTKNAGKRALMIVNPRARRGAASIAPVRDFLASSGFRLIDEQPTGGDSISDLISRHADRCDLVIVGGGDGTLNAAASALVYTGLPLGVLPLGTANDFARTMNIPLDPLKAAELIVQGRTKHVDLGEVNGHLFFNVASIGFSAELAAELTDRTKAPRPVNTDGVRWTSIRPPIVYACPARANPRHSRRPAWRPSQGRKDRMTETSQKNRPEPKLLIQRERPARRLSPKRRSALRREWPRR